MKLLYGIAAVAVIGVSAAAQAMPTGFSDWSPATRVEAEPGTDPSFNGPALDGCPFISRDGLTFYMASNRPGGLGGIDIWAAHRSSPDDPWGAPENLGAPVNSAANDFCPTIDRNGRRLFFVSNRAGGCGGADIYVTRLRPAGWDDPRNLGCVVNSSADEASPFPIPERGKGKRLYFSSVRPGGFAPDAAGATVGDSDVYVSDRHGGAYGTPTLVPGVNTAFEDGQPNLRRDGREIFFFSNRPGTLGMADIYSATRASTCSPWSQPANLGPNVNSADGAETRPSLSWDGTTLYFGSTRPGGEGSTDHYVTTRSRTGA
jgi:Tol biopolymer transport system component